MSDPQSWSATRTRQIVKPFLVLLALCLILQIASVLALIAVRRLGEQSRLQAFVTANQHALVERFESDTYQALVAVVASDEDMLIEEREECAKSADLFKRSNHALLQGGTVAISGEEITLSSADNPKMIAALTAMPSLWADLEEAHVHLLTSHDPSLRGNPDLKRFEDTADDLIKALDDFSLTLQEHSRAQLLLASSGQRLLPIGTLLLTLILGAFAFKRMILPLDASMKSLRESERELRSARDELELRVQERTAELSQANDELRRAEEALRRANEELEGRVKERTQELREAQRRALDLARQAGMTEVATNVLHNVGNVLNSVNTSVTILDERARALRVESLRKTAEMLKSHEPDLPVFLVEDPRGRRLPEYIATLSAHMTTERDEMLVVIGALDRHVHHIRSIVATQQGYATGATMVEATSLRDLIEDAIRISTAALGRHKVIIERRFDDMPEVMVDKHKLLQIILNLISNAKYALSHNAPGDRRIELRLSRPSEDRVRIQVIDNGVGIDPAIAPKIFQHGFTTRSDGHGFGLHSCALAARAMDGTLEAHSDGPRRGATFTLDFPYRPADAA